MGIQKTKTFSGSTLIIKDERPEEILINKISDIRKNNNKQWMDILKIAFHYAPDKTKKVFLNITKNDKKINKLSKELCK